MVSAANPFVIRPGWTPEEVAMVQEQGLAQVIEELVDAIELRDGADPDSRDWTIESRIRTLERRLVDLRRAERPPIVVVIEDETPTLAGRF